MHLNTLLQYFKSAARIFSEWMTELCLRSFLFEDFDEQTADDWDVDMSVYYDKGMCGFFFFTLNLA